MSTLPSLAQEWDQTRSAFATSIMVDTSLASLAQNLEGPSWPISGPNETAATYIDLDYEEVLELLALKGQPPERLEQLIGILRDTLVFDAPFGEMVEQSQVAAAEDNPLLKNLTKLGIAPEHPIELTALAPDTVEFCRLEKLTTLGEFAVFAQGMAQSVIVGGDFRDLLNALSHVDEVAIARYLPFRPGTKGLHLVESVGHLVRRLPAPLRAGIERGETPADVAAAVERRASFFGAETAELRQQVSGGLPLSRVVMVLNDPLLEPAAGVLLQPQLAPRAATPSTPAKRGFLGRLFGR